jgi:hypothetical protein
LKLPAASPSASHQVVDKQLSHDQTMSLLGLAFIGRNNEPLYLCDCAQIIKDADLEMSQQTENDSAASVQQSSSDDGNDASTNNDPLGIIGLTTNGGLRASLGFEHRLMIHSALDQLEELVSTTDVGLPVLSRNAAGAGGFLGVLSKVDEDIWVYGYITATNVKIIVSAEAEAKETEIRGLLSDFHELYVRVSLKCAV